MDAFAKLGIDLWGIVLYVTGFGVLLLVMARYVYKPLLRYLDERRELIRSSVEEAETLREKFEEEVAKQNADNEAYIADVRSKMAEAQRFAKQSARELVADANVRRERLLAEAKDQAEELKDQVLGEVEGELKSRMEKVVLSVLEKSVPKEVVRKSVTESLETYKQRV